MKKHPYFIIAMAAMTMLVACSAKDKAEVKTSPNKGYRTPSVHGPAMRNPDMSLSSDISGATGISYSRVRTSQPYIAMTFDDGPHPRNTPRLLDMLRERNIKATFYVIGRSVNQYPHIARRIVAEGHEIGNHTWSHPNLTKLSDASVRSELDRTRDAIVSACGVQPRTMRPPYGALRSSQRAWIYREYGYPTVLWDVDPEDWKRPGISVVRSRILSGTGNGSIVLAHDLHKSTVDAMPSTLDGLLRKGFKFVTVSQLLALNPPASTVPAAAVR
ncbi:polysaccharide deacetylase family protein [Verrucomicrobiaceae bacterium N1E253]|uniref:Polysaccharide deacetylase family protein n=1 Tax=Oceaniferula marina TaxID=2748318 RepID=A0A851GFN3_9BACT|nr:polysaccharide deacetylase family protein [Oceaniferula marina]NWK54581.1 polysaccharide deacetylase family protein [Oceaniferula marina]